MYILLRIHCGASGDIGFRRVELARHDFAVKDGGPPEFDLFSLILGACRPRGGCPARLDFLLPLAGEARKVMTAQCRDGLDFGD